MYNVGAKGLGLKTRMKKNCWMGHLMSTNESCYSDKLKQSIDREDTATFCPVAAHCSACLTSDPVSLRNSNASVSELGM